MKLLSILKKPGRPICPVLLSLKRHLSTWQELKDFLFRAATFIIAGVLLVWFLIHMPIDAQPAGAATWAGHLGQALAPIFKPLGIGWQETVALIFGFIAKEIVIGGLAVIYGGTDPTAHMTGHISALQAISFMLFCLLYTPCVATIAAIWAESKSIKITAISLTSGLIFAWITSFFFIKPVFFLVLFDRQQPTGIFREWSHQPNFLKKMLHGK